MDLGAITMSLKGYVEIMVTTVRHNIMPEWPTISPN